MNPILCRMRLTMLFGVGDRRLHGCVQFLSARSPSTERVRRSTRRRERTSWTTRRTRTSTSSGTASQTSRSSTRYVPYHASPLALTRTCRTTRSLSRIGIKMFGPRIGADNTDVAWYLQIMSTTICCNTVIILPFGGNATIRPLPRCPLHELTRRLRLQLWPSASQDKCATRSSNDVHHFSGT